MSSLFRLVANESPQILTVCFERFELIQDAESSKNMMTRSTIRATSAVIQYVEPWNCFYLHRTCEGVSTCRNQPSPWTQFLPSRPRKYRQFCDIAENIDGRKTEFHYIHVITLKIESWFVLWNAIEEEETIESQWPECQKSVTNQKADVGILDRRHHAVEIEPGSAHSCSCYKIDYLQREEYL